MSEMGDRSPAQFADHMWWTLGDHNPLTLLLQIFCRAHPAYVRDALSSEAKDLHEIAEEVEWIMSHPAPLMVCQASAPLPTCPEEEDLDYVEPTSEVHCICKLRCPALQAFLAATANHPMMIESVSFTHFWAAAHQCCPPPNPSSWCQGNRPVALWCW